MIILQKYLVCWNFPFYIIIPYCTIIEIGKICLPTELFHPIEIFDRLEYLFCPNRELNWVRFYQVILFRKTVLSKVRFLKTCLRNQNCLNEMIFCEVSRDCTLDPNNDKLFFRGVIKFFIEHQNYSLSSWLLFLL